MALYSRAEVRDFRASKFCKYYWGYSFDGVWVDEHENDRRVYNPYAVLLFFEKMRFAPYWSETGAPSFVFEYPESMSFTKEQILKDKYLMTDFSTFEIEDDLPSMFLAQAGYLTLCLLTGRRAIQPIYELSVPNVGARLEIERLVFCVEYGMELQEW